MNIDAKTLCGMIDSTLLDHFAGQSDLVKLCGHALENSVGAVCVYPEHQEFVLNLIYHSDIKLDAVAGFPTGTDTPKEKYEQAAQRMAEGADEVDMVMNLGWFLDGEFKKVVDDIRQVVDAVHNSPVDRRFRETPVVKVIIESAVLEDQEKKLGKPDGSLIQDAAKAVVDAGADFVKTSTGMHQSGGVRDGHVALIRAVVSPETGVKAAGGIRTWEHVQKLLDEGANRFGTSAAEAIIDGFKESE